MWGSGGGAGERVGWGQWWGRGRAEMGGGQRTWTVTGRVGLSGGHTEHRLKDRLRVAVVGPGKGKGKGMVVGWGGLGNQWGSISG